LKLILTIIISGFCSILFAQKNLSFFKNNTGFKRVFKDTLVTKIAPSAGAAYEDTLYAGDSIEIALQAPYVENRNGFVSPWLKIIYQHGKYKKMGFVSQMDLAIGVTKYKNFEFLWGVIKNNKVDSIANNEVLIKNNYECAFKAIEKSKLLSTSIFTIDNDKKIDSLIFKVIDKVKLNKTFCGIELHCYNTKDTAREFYTFTNIFCQSKKLCSLPITHNYSYNTNLPFPTSFLAFNKNKFLLKTNYGRMMPETIVEEYKWENCSIKLRN
jgi:hypothetical protein